MKNHNVSLLDAHFASDSFSNGRKFKKFFGAFAENFFKKNIAFYEKTGYFPPSHNECNMSASIASSLCDLTPFVISEFSLDCKDAKRAIKDSRGNEKGTRIVDFWFMDGDYEAWVEVKKIWLNIAKSARWAFDSAAVARIKENLAQIQNISTLKPEQCATNCLKIALFATPICCNISQICDEKDIDSAPKYLNDLLLDFIDKRRKMGILSAVLDLRGTKIAHGGYFENEYLPFIALNAVVEE